KHMSDREKQVPPVIAPAPPKPAEPSHRVQKEKQAPLFVDSAVEGTLPPISILDPAEKKQLNYSPESLAAVGHLLEIKLKEFGVEVSVDSIHPGPVITRYEIQPAAGVKVSRISNLAKDLARSLAVTSVRVVEVIPGKTTVGIEIPNEDRQIVRFSEVLSTPEYDNFKSCHERICAAPPPSSTIACSSSAAFHVATLLVALAGCGLSSSRDVAKPSEAAPVSELQSEPVHGVLSK
ncbi:DNA translocase FtsK, partial [Klebsiella pneumoniae]|uniref:DNA translocase FtsK n=1 Tax=Klebsiella pneumoniae TaxID=573 RepID=UPI0039C43FAA